MRGLCVLLGVVLLAPALAYVPPVTATGPPTPGPLQLTSADIPTWLVGESWNYSFSAVVHNGTDWMQVRGNLTSTVTQRFQTRLDGAYLYLYNSSTAGDIHGRGNLTVPGQGTFPFTIRSGTVTGYLWSDRGDLAAVKTNQTVVASGSVNVPILGQRPLSIVGAATVLPRPPEEDFDFPIQLGDTWRVATTVNTTGSLIATVRPTPLPDVTFPLPLNADLPATMQMWANDTALVGGNETLHIHSAAPGGFSADRWYDPNASNYVALEVHAVAGPTQYTHLWMNLTRFSRVNPAVGVSVNLVPNRVGPGAPFEVRGTTAPGAAVRVIIPATNFTAGGVADAAGRFVVNATAPLDNDNTPANTDIGSHGVLVEVTDGGRLGFGAATISLLRPDLTVTGLTAGPPPVGDGIATTLRATLSVTTNVSLYGPVNVAFVAANVDTDGNGVLDSPIGTYCASGLCIGTVTVSPVLSSLPVQVSLTWVPNPATIPSVVVVSAVADPTNRWEETDELNNIVVAPVRVEGPDLTLGNVTVEVLGIPRSFDPAALGFVSPMIAIPMGATVNLTAIVRNAGATNASRPTTLALYTTTGLNGTGSVPFFQTAIPALPAGAETPAVAASWVAPGGAGTYYVNVTADYGNALRETSEANNTFVLRLQAVNATSAPDLIPVDVQIPLKASVNRTVWLSTRVENLGGADASVFHVAFYDGAAPTPIQVIPIGPLPTGSTSSVLSIPKAFSVLGPHVIRIVVDVYDEVPESNETNNTATGTITIVDVPATILSIGTPSVVATNTTYVLPTTPLSLHTEEHTGLGAAVIWYHVDSGNWTPIAEGAPFTLRAGPHTVYYNSTDLLGGSDPTHSANVFVDDEPPTTTSAVSDTADGKVVALAVSDNASGVDWTEYRVDNGTWTRYNSTPFAITIPGTHLVEFRSADLLGNLEVAKSVVVRIEGAGGTIPVAAFNVKPFLALAFVIVLLGVGWFASPYDERKRRQRWFLAVAVPIAIVEAFTGIASLGVPEMAVPGGSLGLPVDIALLAIGLLVIFFSRRRALRNM